MQEEPKQVAVTQTPACFVCGVTYNHASEPCTPQDEATLNTLNSNLAEVA